MGFYEVIINGVEKAKIKKAPEALKNAGAETHLIRIQKIKKVAAATVTT